MAFTDKFVNMAHHFILLRLNPFDFWVDREGWEFEHSVSYLQVSLSAEGAKNVSWPLVSPFQEWGSLTMTFTGNTGKFVYIYIYDYIYLYVLYIYIYMYIYIYI